MESIPYDKRSGKIWFNGKTVDWADANIHILNHGLHYASCVFEGERVYNVAAPVGIFYEDTVPLLEGFYMGNEGLRSYYSIPAMGGSSGSPIFNLRGHLVGMIHSVNTMFPMISVSPKYDELKKFIHYNIKADLEKKSLIKGEKNMPQIMKNILSQIGI